MRILIILRAGINPQTGVVPEYNGLIEAYYLFSDAGADVVLAALGGGSARESPANGANRDDSAAARLRRFNADLRARDDMNDLVDLNRVCTEDFDAALCLAAQGFNGGDGAKDDADVLMDRLLASAKPVAVIVAGPDHSAATSGNGLLMVASGIEASRLAANALLGVASNR
jgi:putative intracellular protease/amidase